MSRRGGGPAAQAPSDPALLADLRGEVPEQDECPGVGTHVLTPRPGCRQLVWIAHAPGDCRRVVDHTCQAHTLSYELMALGGLYLVRRTRLTWDDPRARSVRVIDYSREPWPRPQVHQWWLLLLAGAAR
jgi:hypothetical protein